MATENPNQYPVPTSLRNIPADAMQMVQFVSGKLGIPAANILRLSIICGALIELIKAGPDQSGSYAGFSEAHLAELLRRHLAAPIDFLLEQHQHPYQDGFLTVVGAGQLQLVSNGSAEPSKKTGEMFDDALMDELDDLGFGGGLSDDFEMAAS
jgi:hypothetical protein